MARSRRVPSTRTSVITVLGYTPPLVCGTVHPPGSSQTQYYWDFYEGFVIRVWPITKSISTPSPLSEKWRMGLKVPTLQSWLGLSDEQSSPRSPPSHLIQAKDISVTRNCQGIQELGVRCLISKDIKKVLGTLCQELGSKTKYENKRVP